MKRRQLLKGLGAAALVAPFFALQKPVEASEIAKAASDPRSVFEPLSVSPVAENGPRTGLFNHSHQISHAHSITVDTTPLTEAEVPRPLPLRATFPLTEPLPENYRTYYIVPKVMIEPPERPTWSDPLGQYGYVAVKYLVGGQQYGDWIKISDFPGDPMDALLAEAKTTLRLYSEEKLRLIDPHARFYTF